VTLATLGPDTVLTRGTQLKIQDLGTLFVQSDYSGRYGIHELQAGIDAAQEKKKVHGALSAAQGGVVPAKPTTRIGTPDDGAAIDESLRTLRTTSAYESRGIGVYVQDLVQVLPALKLLAGVRYDRLMGDYDTHAIPNNAPTPVTTTGYRMKVSEWSKRLGLLFQPNEHASYHLSAATSFNTSGDTYSLSAANAGIPPEQAINVEAGAKIDWGQGKFSTGFAIFRATKLHERNTDPLVNLVTLSGKRHVAGFEANFAGRLTHEWEVYGSYTWLPVANIDEAAEGSEGRGTRPSLTPRHSMSLWSTYQLSPRWRVGGGITARSSQTPIRNPGWAVPSFVTADLMAEWTAIRDKLVFKANLSNVGNMLYADSLYSGHYIPGAGRLLQVTGSYKF
jgi:catecholate siderophore receptor